MCTKGVPLTGKFKKRSVAMRKKSFCSMFVLGCLILSTFVCSVNSEPDKWKTYLATGSRNAIAIEGDYVWVGTTGSGLVRVNKVTDAVDYYNTSNSNLPDNYIRKIEIDNSGNKWIITGGNLLVKFDGSTWTVYNHTNSGWPHYVIKYISIDKAGNKWIATSSFQLAKFDGTTCTVYDYTNSGLPMTYLTSIAIDNAGNKWIGTKDSGLVKFDGTTWTIYNETNSVLSDRPISAISIDSAGNKWIGTSGGGLVKFDNATWTVYDYTNSGLPRYNTSKFTVDIISIAIDNAGNKWIGTYSNGLIKFNGTSWTVYDKTNSGLTDNYIASISIDNAGNKWIGTMYGLAKFDNTIWSIYSTNPSSGLPSNYIESISMDDAGNKWMLTDIGLTKFDGNSWTTYMFPDSIGGPKTMLCIDKIGNKWIGERGSFLIKFNDTSWTMYKDVIVSTLCKSIVCDNFGNIWLAGAGQPKGLLKFDGTTWIEYNSTNSGLSFITSIAIDNSGNKWVVDDSVKLSKFDDTNWTVYNCPNPPQPYFTSISIDNAGKKWIGGTCLIKFDNINWGVYDYTNSELPSYTETDYAGDTITYTDYIYSIVCDNAGNKWIGTEHGSLVKFDGTKWTVYDSTNSGLPIRYSSSGNPYTSEIFSIVIDNAGNKWIGTSGGLAVYNENGLDTKVIAAPETSTQKERLENYPNPFNPTTTLKFILMKKGLVKITIHDISGKTVAMPVNNVLQPGTHEVKFGAGKLASGIYHYTLKADGKTITRRMLLVR